MDKKYFALGDSYTIGEQVPLHESFPYQTIQLLRKCFVGEYEFNAPEIIAKTGWTTDELLAQIDKTNFSKNYDFVTLLIGVNNQYRGRTVVEFAVEFSELISKAINFAGGKNNHVIVLSIPDWGVTPFAEGKDHQKIALEIDAYNAVCKKIAAENNCTFIDITDSQRKDAANADFLAEDKLHPSGKEYMKWAIAVSEKIKSLVKD